MFVTHLSLADFRSWEFAELALEPGVTTLTGRNGQGKTNLVEAVEYLATLGSHRVASDAPLIRFGAPRAIVRARVQAGIEDTRTLALEVELHSGKANKASINRGPLRRVRDILGALRVVLFSPEDLALVKGDPDGRRRFLDELVTQVKSLKPGDPTGRDTDIYGPLSSESAADGLAEQIAAAKEAGATVHVGGERVSAPEGEGFYVSPAVITDVDQENPAYSQELFGMASVVYKVSSAEEAVALANDSQYGLGGAVFSTDLDEAKRVADQLEVGMANVNLASAAGANLPFGGVKRSGFGRELGPLALDEFANKRLYAVQGPLEG